MKMKPKLVRVIFIISISLLVFSFFGTPAATASNKGNLEMKIDRIMKDESERTSNLETELDKVFPTLFAEETTKEINRQAAEKRQSLEELENMLFKMDAEPNKTLQVTKDSLFTNDYVATSKQAADVNETEEESTSESGNTWLIALAGVALLLSTGLYFMMQKMLN